MRLRFLAPSLLAAVACLAGCATNVLGSGEQGDAEAASSAATAVVVVERTVSATYSGGAASGGAAGVGVSETARGEAVARVIRMRSGAVDDDALRLVGGAVDLPALGTCAALGAPAAPSGGSSLSLAAGAASLGTVPGPQAASVGPVMRAMALVDVGAVSLEAGGVRTPLAPRQLPDVADLVSGVVYTARPAEAAIPARGHFVLRAAGSADLEVAPFVVDAVAPGEPADLRIAGQDAHGAAGVSLAALPPSTGAELTWTPGSADDVVYVDVIGASVPGGASAAVAVPTVRCLFADAAGRATVPPAALLPFEDGTINVHRLHRESFHARGVDPGEVRFDFARAVPFSRR